MSRPVAVERARRLLSIAPWIASRGGPTVAEVCERFSIGPDDLYADLEVLSMVGVPPYSPDALVDVLFEDGRVWVTLGSYFQRPLRLTALEAMSLVAAARIVGAGDPVLSSAADKISAVAGDAQDGDVLGADLGELPANAVADLLTGIEEHRRVRLDYYGFNSAQRTTREVDPHRLHVSDGHWYLSGYCHLAGAERIFRLDRVHSLVLLDSSFEPPPAPVEAVPFTEIPDDSVRLRLRPSVRWVVEALPTIASVDLPDGGVDVTLPVGGSAWLERLLLRLGPDAEILGGTTNGTPVGPEPLVALRANAARRILNRYRGPDSGR